jgi:branched-chain amino acid transport system ATP-binding protein
VREVTLEVHPGERKALIGPNGAGKTTLFNLITGVFPPSSGEIVLFGQDVTRWPSHQRTALGMARTFQITSLFPKLTVLENVLLALAGVGWSKLVMWKPLSSYKEHHETARRLLEAAGYWDRRDVEVRNLSHGEQRQIEVVLGLASEPRLLLLDEPAAGLSSGESREMAHPKPILFAMKPPSTTTGDRLRTSCRHFGPWLNQHGGFLCWKRQQIYLGTG